MFQNVRQGSSRNCLSNFETLRNLWTGFLDEFSPFAFLAAAFHTDLRRVVQEANSARPPMEIALLQISYFSDAS